MYCLGLLLLLLHALLFFYKAIDWQQHKALTQLYWLLVCTLIISSLISFSDVAVGKTSWLPFHSYLDGQVATGLASLLAKIAIFSALLWLALEQGYQLEKQALMLAFIISLSEISQLFIISRVFDLGDVLLVLLAYLLVRHVGDSLAAMTELTAVKSDKSSPSEQLISPQAKVTIASVVVKHNMHKFLLMFAMGFIAFYIAVKSMLALPNVPYNVLDMFRNHGNVIDVLFFYLAGFSLFIGAFWVGSSAHQATGVFKVYSHTSHVGNYSIF